MKATKIGYSLLLIIHKFLPFLIFDQIFSFKVNAIINGDDANVGQFPYQVAVKVRNKYICGGGIIDELFVITAAHCVTYPDGEFRDGPVQIIAGLVDMFDIDDYRRVEADVEKVYVPNRYGRRRVADIAIIKTKQNLLLKRNNLQRLYLPTQTDVSYVGETVVIAGIGWDEITSTYGQGNNVMENGTTSGLLSWANAKVLPVLECEHRGHYYVRDSHLCARMIKPGLLPYGICSGDSGGPLVLAGRVVIGVAIGSPPSCNEAYFPGLYTRITSYLGFINNALKDNTTDMRVKIYESRLSEKSVAIECLDDACRSEKYEVDRH